MKFDVFHFRDSGWEETKRVSLCYYTYMHESTSTNYFTRENNNNNNGPK